MKIYTISEYFNEKCIVSNYSSLEKAYDALMSDLKFKTVAPKFLNDYYDDGLDVPKITYIKKENLTEEILCGYRPVAIAEYRRRGVKKLIYLIESTLDNFS